MKHLLKKHGISSRMRKEWLPSRKLLKLGKIKIDEVSDCFPDLPDSDIKELEAEVVQLA